MNKMKEVAELLGVQLDEEFELVGRENRYRITENGLEMLPLSKGAFKNVSYSITDLLLNGKLEIKKPILKNQEKEYLENVIRPFKDRVKEIVKFKHTYKKDYEYIRLHIPNDNYVVFPAFEMGSIYKGMEIDKHYTLKELGLFDNE